MSFQISSKAEKLSTRSRKEEFKNHVNFVKYPFAIIMFSFALIAWFKYKLNEHNLEIQIKESVPKFH
jgi:hypothetical protein